MQIMRVYKASKSRRRLRETLSINNYHRKHPSYRNKHRPTLI